MRRFKDQRLLEIHLYGRTAGVPADDCAFIQGELVTLLAVTSWSGVEVVGEVFPLDGGRLAMMLTPEWGVSFEWWEGEGAFELGLEP